MSYQMLRYFVASGHNLNLKRSICLHRILYGTHYETLKLPRNCTSKEVRDSFIKLSKQCHPDKKRDDPNTHAQFVKLNEAYSVLSRPDKRREYDLTLKPIFAEKWQNPHQNSPFDVYTTAYRQRVVWRDESFWEYKDKTSQNQSGDYYGIRGLKRVPNGWIALLCVAFAVAGLWLQVLFIRYSTAFNRQTLDDRSHEASRVLSEVQERALKHGNKMQLEILKQHSEKTRSSKKPPEETHAVKNKAVRHPKLQMPKSNDSTSAQPSDHHTKPYLGYLGDMPHRVERDNLKPLLCNTTNGIDKKSRTVVDKQNAPKSLANGQDVAVGKTPFGQDSGNPVLHNLPNNIIKQDANALLQPKLCNIAHGTSKSNGNGNVETEENLMTLEIFNTSNDFNMNSNFSASVLNSLDINLLSMLENEGTYISPMVNELFPIHKKLSVHNSYSNLVCENQIFDHIKKHVDILKNTKQKNLTNIMFPVNSQPILTSDVILMTDSEIFFDKLVPIPNRKC